MKNATGLKLICAGRIVLLAVACCCSLAGIILIARSLQDPYVKDLRQGYLLACAMAQGVDPYLPLPELGRLYLPGHPFTGLPHPTPHPFAVGWLCLPLVLLSYEQAAVVWLIFQLSCLAFCTALLSRMQGIKIEARRVALVSFFLLGWWPLVLEVWWAQLSLCLLVLFLGAWRALRQGRDGLAGVFLGCLALLKLAGWPIILWLALQRRWRVVLSAGLFWAVAHLLAIGLHGWGMVRDYYLKVGPEVSEFYRMSRLNLSVWTVGERLFAESGYSLVTTPLWESPLLANVVTLLVPVALLILTLRVAQRLKDFDTVFALLMAIGSFLNPITWQNYFLLSSPALLLLFRRLRALQWPRLTTCAALLLVIAISLPQEIYSDWAKLFATGSNASGQVIAPALPGLLTLVPLGALCLLLGTLTRLRWQAHKQASLNGDAIELAPGDEGNVWIAK